MNGRGLGWGLRRSLGTVKGNLDPINGDGIMFMAFSFPLWQTQLLLTP